MNWSESTALQVDEARASHHLMRPVVKGEYDIVASLDELDDHRKILSPSASAFTGIERINSFAVATFI